jgi:hypothetical protein
LLSPRGLCFQDVPKASSKHQSLYDALRSEDKEPQPPVRSQHLSNGSCMSNGHLQRLEGDATEGPPAPPLFRDWTAEFQLALESPQESVEQELSRAQSIKDVVSAFVAVASRLGKIIISEVRCRTRVSLILLVRCICLTPKRRSRPPPSTVDSQEARNTSKVCSVA